MQNTYQQILIYMNTRTKVVHENVSEGCNLIRRIKSIKISQPLHNSKKGFYDHDWPLRSYFIIELKSRNPESLNFCEN